MKLVIAILGVLISFEALAKNGFDLSDSLVPAREIRSGGPPRDGIPAIYKPAFETAEQASEWLTPDNRVLGVVVRGQARAYPVRILNWHEIVNDRIEDQYFTVTYCPLCGTGMVFAANAGKGALLFGVSGLLYNSDVLLYDHNSESLWSQILGKAISGKLKGTELPQLAVTHTTFKNWTEKHPDTNVLSRSAGLSIDYRKSPYENYEKTRRLYFKVSHRAPSDFHPKERVMGVVIGDVKKAYPFVELSKNSMETFIDSVGGQDIVVQWDQQAQSAIALGDRGEQLPTVTGFWFAWYTFHPDTEVFVAP